MNFIQISNFLKNGYKVRRNGWKGYWVMEDGEIIMYCNQNTDNDELVPIPLKETKDILFTLNNVASNDWMIVEEE